MMGTARKVKICTMSAAGETGGVTSAAKGFSQELAAAVGTATNAFTDRPRGSDELVEEEIEGSEDEEEV